VLSIFDEHILLLFQFMFVLLFTKFSLQKIQIKSIFITLAYLNWNVRVNVYVKIADNFTTNLFFILFLALARVHATFFHEARSRRNAQSIQQIQPIKIVCSLYAVY